ncbi:DUF1152 domain-containing protein [Patulibacter defluvii]|uniref:DUF1152 domain-containing protein n=1 Tax=Patulibacter defluvii TaxID=3095358 RepID=UPI002A752196|nr:DUF1152 domain-containing protein [Patulibacter sp. DM4]
MSHSSGGASDRAATAVLPDAERLLCVGIGGGGDVVGALAAAQLLGREAVLGGLTWERLPVDPVPGPRRIDELVDAAPLSPTAALATGETRTATGVRFAESRIAEHLGATTVLIDPTPGPAAVADGLDTAAERLGCDGIVLVDVGGDVLAHGHEETLGSPLADAVLLAAGALLARRGLAVAAAVVGAGCDGELTPDEVAARIAEAAEHGGLLADEPLSPAGLDQLEAAVVAVPTEASALAVRCARGERGPVPIRGGRRTVHCTELGGRAIFLDVEACLAGPARLAVLVLDAADLDDADRRLAERGILSELAWERRQVAAAD